MGDKPAIFCQILDFFDYLQIITLLESELRPLLYSKYTVANSSFHLKFSSFTKSAKSTRAAASYMLRK